MSVGSRNAQTLDLGRGTNSRNPARIRYKEGDLAEEVPGAELRVEAASQLDGDGAVEDDEHA